MIQGPVLSVKNLAVSYKTRKGHVDAVRDVTFDICEGENLGLVGESGCGKSTVAFSIVNFLGPNGSVSNGQILFKGQELRGRTEEELRKLRGADIAMVYQEPMSALNPSMLIRDQLAESLIIHRGMKQRGRLPRVRGSAAPRLHARRGRRDEALLAPALGRAAAARSDRHGDAQQPGAPDHGRADDGARRDGRGRGARPDRRAQREVPHRDPLHQPQPRRRRARV